MNRFIIFIMALLFSQLAMAFSYTVELTEAELQEKVEAMMPLEKKKFFVKVVLSKPRIELLEGQHKIGIFSHIDVTAPQNLKGSGTAKITGSVDYKPESGAFFFKDPVIESLQINQFPEEYIGSVQAIAQLVISKVLAKRPVYTLKDDNLKQKLAKALLHSVSVKNKVLLLELRI